MYEFNERDYDVTTRHIKRRKKPMAKFPQVAIKATLAWPFLNNKSDMSGKYEVNLCGLTTAQAKKLVAIGIPKERIRKEDPKKLKELEAAGKTVFDKGPLYLVVKSGEKYFTVKDSDKQLLSDDVLVGNGTVATVIVKAVAYKGFGGGVMAGLGDVIIHELVEYEAPDDEEETASDDASEDDDDDDEDWDA